MKKLSPIKLVLFMVRVVLWGGGGAAAVRWWWDSRKGMPGSKLLGCLGTRIWARIGLYFQKSKTRPIESNDSLSGGHSDASVLSHILLNLVTKCNDAIL